MNLELNRSREHDFALLVNRMVFTIDDQTKVLNHDGPAKLFFKKEGTIPENPTIKDLLQEDIYEKAIHYIHQSLLTKSSIISKYHLISGPDGRFILRFLVYPGDDTLSTTAIVIEAMLIDDNTIVSDKPISDWTSDFPTAHDTDWKALFDYSPAETALINLKGELLKYNKAFCASFGYADEEMQYLNLADLIPSNNVFLKQDIVKLLLDNKIPYYKTEKQLKRKDNTFLKASVKVSLLKESRRESPCFIIQIQEVTNIIPLENALVESEAKYKALSSNSNQAIFLMQDEALIECNDRALKMFSLERKEIRTLSLFSLSPEFQPDGERSTVKIEKHIALALKGTSPFFYWKFQKSDGLGFEAEVSVKSLIVPKGTLIQVIVKDISQRKERERAMRESESRFKGIFEGAGIGIGMTDPYGKMIESNQALEHFIGYSKEELLGKSIIELVHPEDRDFEKRYLAFYQGTHLNPGFFEKRYIRKDGSTVWGKLTTTVIYDEKGIPSYGIAMLEDITQRKLAEKKASENQELLNRINENLSEGIYRSIPGKGLVYVNKALAKMFGYESVAEALHLSSESLNELYDEADRRGRLLKEIKKKRHLKNKESLFRRKDNTTFWGLENSSVSTTPEGEMIIDGVVVDITERKQSEELLKNKNEELKKINEELDRFVYSASHDLRAPLTSLLGLINIAQQDRYINGIGEHLELMRKSVLKMDSFIIDIINYSRNTRLDIEVEEIDLNALVYEVLDNHRYISSTDKIEKRVKISQKVPLYSDSKRLSVLLNNLVSNAIRYHNLILDRPFIEVKGVVMKKAVRLDIIDNGKGIGKQYLDNIFEMFFRASDDSKGSGLGLYIVKETVAKLDGEVKVTSEIGKGSTFSIVIPNLAPSRRKGK